MFHLMFHLMLPLNKERNILFNAPFNTRKVHLMLDVRLNIGFNKRKRMLYLMLTLIFIYGKECSI